MIEIKAWMKRNPAACVAFVIAAYMFWQSEYWSITKGYGNYLISKLEFTRTPSMESYFSALPEVSFKPLAEMRKQDQHLSKSYDAFMRHVESLSASKLSLTQCFNALEMLLSHMEADIKTICGGYQFDIAKTRILDSITDELLDCRRLSAKLQEVFLKINIHFSNQKESGKGMCASGVSALMTSIGLPGLHV